MKHEASITHAALALGACQRVLLVGQRVQEHREVGADRAIALDQHVLGTRADHHPIDISDRLTQQAVAYSTANFINLHKKPP
ncbi:hypothetical protein ALP29_201561 [Pseudomonas syringae pv. avii]|uniref:Uncharacterized protein n=1 Tax=Pseudomonas syringae pv. avii TaxID=663959 RepID=A0A3M5UKT6_PSESX|nr:hypothetical protein ALP29_201561 [Pseudomonas syringae pv. avii]